MRRIAPQQYRIAPQQKQAIFSVACQPCGIAAEARSTELSTGESRKKVRRAAQKRRPPGGGLSLGRKRPRRACAATAAQGLIWRQTPQMQESQSRSQCDMLKTATFLQQRRLARISRRCKISSVSTSVSRSAQDHGRCVAYSKETCLLCKIAPNCYTPPSRVAEFALVTAVDFAAFVERLAQVSGEVILPFFRSAIGAEDKSRGGVFDPVTEADRGAEAAMRRLIAQTFPAHGVIGEEYGAGPAGRRICLGARPDRRHQELHLGPADLGHADRPHAQRPRRSTA